MGIKEIMHSIFECSDTERLRDAKCLMDKMLDYIEKNSPDAYRRFLEDAEDIMYEITEDEARQIVRDMRPYGEKWTVDDVCTLTGNDDIEYYLVMNMCYNDYRRTAQAHNLDSVDFYFDLAKDFINDEDARHLKVEKYFKK